MQGVLRESDALSACLVLKIMCRKAETRHCLAHHAVTAECTVIYGNLRHKRRKIRGGWIF